MNMILMSGSSSEARAGELDAVHLRHHDVGEQHFERLFPQPLIGGHAVVMGRDLKTGVFQRLDQETAHVVVVFSEQDFWHGRKRRIPRGYQQSLLSRTEGKFGVKILTPSRLHCRLLVNRNAARINRAAGASPLPCPHG
ncbi:hypothetical protein ABH973_001499 [Bradyrhizobium ottawaense]